MDFWDAFSGPNAGYVYELYDRFCDDPQAVDGRTRQFFEAVQQAGGLPAQSAGRAPASGAGPGDLSDIVGLVNLARNIRQFGHLSAHINPLEQAPSLDPTLEPKAQGLSDEKLATLPAGAIQPAVRGVSGSALEAVRKLIKVYCGTIGYDFSHVHNYEEREWLIGAAEGDGVHEPSPDERKRMLYRLAEVEGFEQYLQQNYQGQKRFSIEGLDILVPMLDDIVRLAVHDGTREVFIGMAHRGRLNVLAHVLDKPYGIIFSEFDHAPGSAQEVDITQGWTGDVKYHLGRHHKIHNGASAAVEAAVTVANNPSHLEFVNPVVQGLTRAAQEDRDVQGPPSLDTTRALNVTIHGDAAFPGEGVVAETLNLSRLESYTTGGTLHIIANNQLGFTTEPREGRSTLYASDLAKGFEIPIIHVNGDDPQACIRAIKIAYAYRERFQKDFLVDVVGYRRWGHNEGDEPSFTQPVMYGVVRKHPTVRALYAERLEAAGIIAGGEAKDMQAEVKKKLREAREDASDDEAEAPPADVPERTPVSTAVPADRLRKLNEALLHRPEGFSGNSKLERLIERRRELIDKPGGIDWAHAETLAFATILSDGHAIRLAGQDTARGTFSQRHLRLRDIQTGAWLTPLQQLEGVSASFEAINSPLSEAAAMGFEYGYSLRAPDALVLWEAQFGDFANAGQVLVDQFLSSGQAKWREQSSLVLLLPHGYEGQGPEHSSARLERYLQLAAQDNIRVVNCTTAAQYFHLLRRQAALLQKRPRPLVVMTPKSLLRHPKAGVSLEALAGGSFAPLLYEPARTPESVVRLVLCSGKVAVDYETEADKVSEARELGVLARVEQLYPFPKKAIGDLIAKHPNATEVVWLQEEPMNMGAWSYVAPRLEALLPQGISLRYIGRSERAATAEGLADLHASEQSHIIHDALPRQESVLQAQGGRKHGR